MSDAAALGLGHPNAAVFVPDGTPVEAALARTTHLGVGAHQDDLEILAIDGILACFGAQDRWFTGVVVTDGAGSPRTGAVTSEPLTSIRRKEQRKAAHVGEYSALVELAYPSARAKDASDGAVTADLTRILRATAPEVVYTHDLADRHDTHVAVALRVIEAARALPAHERPRRVIGCEVWRDLDWLPDADRVVMALPDREHLESALLGVFDSQIAGGKRYDRATLGRRRARATFAEHHAVDHATAIVLGMDLTPLLDGGDVEAFVDARIQRFAAEVRGRLRRLSAGSGGDRD